MTSKTRSTMQPTATKLCRVTKAVCAIEPTEAELRVEFARTGLFRIGMAYERAMKVECVRIALTGAVLARHRREVHRRETQ